MDRLFDKKSRRSYGSSQRHISLGIPTNVAAGPLGFRAELDIGPKGEQGHSDRDPAKDQPDSTATVDEGGARASRIVFHAKKSEDQVTPAPETSTSDTAVGGDQHCGDGPSKDNAGNTRKEEGKLAKVSTAPERDNKDAVHEAVDILFDVTQEPTDVAQKPTDGFGPLKAALEAASSTHIYRKGTPAVRNEIENLLSSIAALEALFATHPGNVAEQRRRGELICTFEGIEGQLKTLSESPGQQGPEDFRDDEAVSGFLEDLREAIDDYNMVQRKGADNQARKLMSSAEAAILNSVRCAYAAEYRHSDRKGCLKGTRRAILSEIDFWISDFGKPPVYWLNGLAGTGKTTIAQTIAERLFAGGQLGASFFCSRDFSDRRDLRFIFPTLAVQLARKYTEFRSIFVPLVELDPGIVCESLYNQMKKLIVGPLKESAISTVIVIDALDECRDEEPASAILSVLGQFVLKIPKVKFFLTGRPEPRIREGFRLPLLAEATNVFVLHDVEPSLVSADIRIFFERFFLDLTRRRRGLDDWPTKEQVDLLCNRAAGLFVYAVATVKFVDRRNNSPKEQLDRLLQSPESSAREGKTEFKPDITLDSLYMTILQDAFGRDDPEDDPKILSVLSAVMLAANPLSPSTIAALLGYDVDGVFPILSSVHSLLILQEDIDHLVRPFHKSFPDFIVDPIRCTNRRFHVSPGDHHSQLLVGCLGLMNKALEKNICRLPDAVANSDISDLEERIERYIDPALQYACRSWHTHLVDAHKTQAHAPTITSTLHQFLEEKFLFWLEVLSVLSAVRNAVDALQAAADWLEEPQTLDLANDCSRFLNGYFAIISTSPSHIYHSALVLAPKTSIVRKLYESHALPFVRVVRGTPESWDPNTAATMFPSEIKLVKWSPCSRFIAVIWVDAFDRIEGSGTVTVDILDPVTLQRLQTLKAPRGTPTDRKTLCFSPDCRTLAYTSAVDSYSARDLYVVVWDLQTGGVVSTIREQGSGPRGGIYKASITCSMDGKVVGVLHSDRGATAIFICDLASSRHIHTHSLRIPPQNPGPFQNLIPALANIWTHGEAFRFVTLALETITVWEVGFDSGATSTEVETISIPDNMFNDLATSVDARHAEQVLFVPAASRLAVTNSFGTLLAWDAQNSRLLLHCAGIQCHLRISFSSDGRFLACSTAGSEIYLWKESHPGYTLHGIVTSTRNSDPVLSPNGELMVEFGGRLIQLWRTKDFTTITSNRSTSGPRSTRSFALDLCGVLVAVARRGDDVVRVLDLESGAPWLTIHTSMRVYGLKVTRDAVVVVGNEKAITWNLPAGDCVPGTGVGVKDSARTINLSERLPRARIIAASISPDLHRVAITTSGFLQVVELDIYDASTGEHLRGVAGYHGQSGGSGYIPRFAPDGSSIWCAASSGESDVWTITGNGDPHPIRLEREETLVDPRHPPEGYPWGSSRGYRVTNDGWVLGPGPGATPLLMLPPSWRSNAVQRVWNGQFLALLHGGLPEPVILELEP